MVVPGIFGLGAVDHPPRIMAVAQRGVPAISGAAPFSRFAPGTTPPAL